MFQTRIKSFDRTGTANCKYDIPDKYTDIFKQYAGPVIAKGAGLSYCNAAVMEGGTSVDLRAFDRILTFDHVNGFITVEAGICIGDLNNFLIGNGWMLGVIPGYPMITIGGCIAFNVHGKSQYRIGTFYDWVEEISLYHPAKGELRCSGNEHKELFDLTNGGMGFTGFIIAAKLRLKKINGNKLNVKTIRAANVADAVKIIQENADNFDYIYSWNNFNCTGKSFGKGIVYLEKIGGGFANPYRPRAFRNRLKPTKFPCLLNNFTVKWMCRTYYFMDQLKSSNRQLKLEQASFPIYGKEIYYKLFGKKGFREYQVLFPYATWQNAAREIQELIAATNMGITLGSLKIFNGTTHHISFTGEGICFAIDVVNSNKSVKFFESLDEITKKQKGIINLSKDSRAGADLVKEVYPGYTRFKEAVNNFDPQRLLMSDLRNRLKI
jgi:decaprenylphospho-beta-D-ribofuranose 2-oxidase